jgi:hypothetical protein
MPLGSITSIKGYKMITQNKMTNKSKSLIQSLIAFITVLLIFSSCDEDGGFGEYYEGNFNDQIILVNQSDTSNIIIEQPRMLFLKDSIPYSEEINNAIADSINLKLFVSFGSYNQTPRVVKETNKILDTFYVWYSTRDKIRKILYKNNSITEVTTSPRLEYVSIDSIAIQKASNKVISLYSRLTEN